MNLEKLKLRLENYENRLREKLASINPKRKFPQRAIENLNNKIQKQTNKIIKCQEKEIIKANKKLAVNKMNNKIKEIKNIGKPVNRQTNKTDRAYQRILEKARKTSIFKDKPNNKIDKIFNFKEDKVNKNIDREYQKLMEQAKKLNIYLKKKYNYFLRINFYKRAKPVEENKNPEPEEEVYNISDDERDTEGNIYTNIWRYALTIKLDKNPRELKINEFYNDIDDGVQFIKNCIELFIEDTRFYEEYYQHFKSYINGFKINSISKIELIDGVNLENIDEIKYKLDDDNIAIYNRFTQYSINENGNTFKGLLDFNFSNEYLKNNYRKNCCFLTAIINKYYNRFNVKDSKGIRK